MTWQFDTLHGRVDQKHAGNRLRTRDLRITRGIRAVGRLICTIVLVIQFSTIAQCQTPPQYINRGDDIKAAYLYNFGKYVSWPENGTSQHAFVIGVVGRSSLADRLSVIVRNKSLKDSTITVKHIERPEQYEFCHILFVSADHDADILKAILAKALRMPTLVVGEQPGFVTRGGMIGFYLDNNNLKFEINPPAAERSGLTISSKLLSIGKIVQK